MKRPKHGLGAKKEAAIQALLTARSIEEAARQTNTPVRTLYRWLSEKDFDEALRKARRTSFRQTTGRLQQASPAAVTTLLKLTVDGSAPAAVRARASYYVLSMAHKAIETEDIEARITALEHATESEEDF